MLWKDCLELAAAGLSVLASAVPCLKGNVWYSVPARVFSVVPYLASFYQER